MSASRVRLVGSFPQNQILGMGRTGLVIRQDEETAVKLPLRWESSREIEVELNIESIQRERDIYQRLGDCPGVVRCLGSTETTIHLQLMKKGDLRAYLSNNQAPKSLQLAWFRDMARALSRIHNRGILVVDIATRNLLLDADLSVKFCDFSESSIFPLETLSSMDTADDGGYSVQTDIGQLGAVIYEVVTGNKCDFDLWKEDDNSIEVCYSATWPQRHDLPPTEGVWLGEIIEKCWTKGAFRNALDLLAELESVTYVEEADTSRLLDGDFNSNFQALWRKVVSTAMMEYIISPIGLSFGLAITGVVVFNTWWRWRSRWVS